MRKGTLSILSTLAGIVIGVAAMGKVIDKSANKAQAMSDKHLALFLMMNRWIQVKQEGKTLTDYLEKHDYKVVAIYGISYVGERLLDELKGSNITVKYGIDKEADGIHADIPVVYMDDLLEEVDAVIVTAISFIDEIESTLSTKISCPIISLEDILYDM